MEITLLRSSLVANEGNTPDAHAFLSLEGRQLVRAIGNKIRLADEPSYDAVLAAPSPAAVQTAELFADRVDFVGAVEVMPALGANVPPEVIAPQLLTRGAAIVVVADEPALSALGAFLVGRPTFPPLVRAQVSVIRDRRPAWSLRPGEHARSLLLLA